VRLRGGDRNAGQHEQGRKTHAIAKRVAGRCWRWALTWAAVSRAGRAPTAALA
jgi:hypothetical protein